MDDKGDRIFGDNEGELSSAEARRIIKAGNAGHRARPVAGLADVAMLCFALAAFLLLGWCAVTP